VRRVAIALSALGFLWALAASVLFLGGAAPDGSGVSLLTSDGVWVVALLSVLTLVAGLPLGLALRHPAGLRPVSATAGAIVLVISVAAGATVGLRYVPACVALFGSAAIAPGRSSAPFEVRSAP